MWEERMTDKEKNLLEEYRKETNYPWTLEYLIDDHRNLSNERVETDVLEKEAKARGFLEGHAIGIRSAEILNKKYQKNELKRL
jgi:hypothetical protein